MNENQTDNPYQSPIDAEGKHPANPKASKSAILAWLLPLLSMGLIIFALFLPVNLTGNLISMICGLAALALGLGGFAFTVLALIRSQRQTGLLGHVVGGVVANLLLLMMGCSGVLFLLIDSAETVRPPQVIEIEARPVEM